MLERLAQRRNLRETLVIEVEVPANLPVDDLTIALPLNWRALGSPEAATAGGQWLLSKGAALLKVPSALVPSEANYLIKPTHPDTARLVVGAPERLEWDARQ